jgi:5-methyltetrahydropteroyltriglutamate--homocysteine methyltransferase
VSDFLYAKNLAGNKPLKAHVTGAMTMARTARVEPGSGYVDRNDRNLILDLAKALGQEAKALVQAGAQIVQIDEPVLADGADLDIAFEAMREIIEIGEIPFPALHICGNVTKIMEQVLLESPVQMISMEGMWLDSEPLSHIDRGFLSKSGKKIGLGCIRVADYSIEKLTKVQNFLDRMMNRLGEEHIWAAMPNCGLRPIPHEVALAKLEIMVQAARSL